jgi:hypothetical protein
MFTRLIDAALQGQPDALFAVGIIAALTAGYIRREWRERRNKKGV